MYKQTKKKINFFRNKKDVNFIVWICPLLKPLLLIEETSIYKEEEKVKQIYFLEQGKAAYILPRYNSLPYCYIEEGEAQQVAGIPNYAVYSENSLSFRWRDIYDYGFVDETNAGVNYPFLNGVHYPFELTTFRLIPEGSNENLFINIIQDPTIDECE